MKTKFMTMFGFLLLLCTAFGSSANAQCLFSFNRGGAAAASPSLLKRTAATTEAARKDAIAENRIDATTVDNPTITGLWDLKFISDDQLVDEGFDQYHSDGTEILNDIPPPSAGNVCLGVWAKTGVLTLKLKHPSWIYDPTNTFVIGTATILEQVTLASDGNSFAGTFTVQLRDLSGNSLGPDLAGQLQATRITPD